MSEIDDRIREALRSSESDDELLKERSMFSEVVTPFRGKRRWVNWLGLLYGSIANVAFFYSAYQFFTTDDTNEKLNWIVIGGFALMFVAFSKLYFWLEMQSNRVLREVKRVELLIVSGREGSDD
ncbi:DUF6768 family protein [Pelagicoccus sp. SDUM812003]|uniref:DUF6768 family protein n=1 Tax=Pelagicoccus sp. SDUM812003 TaxID=3041267 RepID=UPI0028105814|nr:DUF6768 family protein [Pelagicoccus sp. SDUM812003]MDQ8203737.1 hypothetical protein [Pelagicoccus sp. SDUM812003]